MTFAFDSGPVKLVVQLKQFMLITPLIELLLLLQLITVHNIARSNIVCGKGACYASHAPATIQESHAICADQTMQFISDGPAAAQKGRGGQKAQGGEERGARGMAKCKYYKFKAYKVNCIRF